MPDSTPDRPDDAHSGAPNDAPDGAPNAADLPPAYFLSLTLENVRCFGPEQTLDLSDGDGNWAQWTVILGDNGTGKTTLLQLLALLEPVTAVDEPRDIDTRYMHEHGWAFALDLRRFGRRTSSRVRSSIQARGLNRSPFEFGFEHPLEGYTSGITTIPIQEPVERREALGLNCLAFGAHRQMESGGFQSPKESETRSLFDDEFFLPNAHDWLLQTDYAAKRGKEKASNRLSQILDALADILPDVEEVQIKDQKGDTALPKVEFHTPYGWVMMDQLSLGYRTMIAWIVDLARRLFERYPDMENPLEGPAVCLVDEIDLHLHPKWQRKIIGFLSERFPNTQFIVTAHSPLIVQAAQDANIAVLKRSEEPDETGAHYVEIHNDLEPLRNLRVDQILTSDLYGLDSARPPQIEDLVQEKIEILSKSTLSEEDEARLEELENEIGHLPAGETKEERETLDFMRRVAERLESEGKAVQPNDA